MIPQVQWQVPSPAVRIAAWVVLSLGVLGILLVNLVPSIERWALDRPATCSLKLLTNFPCLACRGTRSAFAFANGNLLQSFLFNPAAALLAAATLIWSGIVVFRRRSPSLNWPKPFHQLGGILIVAGLVGNWIYIVAVGG